VPWLEPDIIDHLEALSAKGIDAVVVCPIGFVSDHVEVVWDLDTEARQRAADLGMAFARAATPGADPRFARLVADLVDEHRTGLAARRLGTVPGYGCTRDGELCAIGCCAPPRRPGAPRDS
jgi:ferrochelatase